MWCVCVKMDMCVIVGTYTAEIRSFLISALRNLKTVPHWEGWGLESGDPEATVTSGQHLSLLCW